MDRDINKIQQFLEFLIGKTKEEASKLCKENDYEVRVVREDKNNYVITMDLRFNRVNLEIDNDLVTKCDIG